MFGQNPLASEILKMKLHGFSIFFQELVSLRDWFLIRGIFCTLERTAYSIIDCGSWDFSLAKRDGHVLSDTTSLCDDSSHPNPTRTSTNRPIVEGVREGGSHALRSSVTAHSYAMRSLTSPRIQLREASLRPKL